MPRSVQISVPSEKTDDVIREMMKVQGLTGLRLQRGISLMPPGDSISVEITSRSLQDLMRLLDRMGIGQSIGSVVTSHPLGIVSSPHASILATDTSEAIWEEVELTIGRESNMTLNGLLLMIAAGCVTVIGISTGALHLVIGAMVIAPGFEPISRIALGLAAGGQGWRRGAIDTAKAYTALILAAGVTAFNGRKSARWRSIELSSCRKACVLLDVDHGNRDGLQRGCQHCWRGAPVGKPLGAYGRRHDRPCSGSDCGNCCNGFCGRRLSTVSPSPAPVGY
jgi:hypothetical protein